MLRAFGILSFLGVCVVAVIGIAGDGPYWFRYVGSGLVVTLLVAILSHIQDVLKLVEGVPGDHVEKDDSQAPSLEDHFSSEDKEDWHGWRSN